MKFWSTVIFATLGFAVMVTLGVWQLQRLEWKEGELAKITSAQQAAPVPLDALSDPAAEKYRPVFVTGTLGTDEIFILVSTRDRGAGYRVISPLETATGRRVLIDRGYIPLEAKDVSRPLQTDITVNGNVHVPDDRNASTPQNDVAGNIWFARDVDDLAAALQTEPVLIVARSDTGQGILPLPVTTEGIPNNHLSYAIQWFLFAAIWAGVTTVLAWRIRARTD
ncbi:SURF1 family protein [Celeribacter arenosi]|uniref:SURF1-like protein n=1 Tax=Celeribacter arenosi TaxID=792649 RepID=A0ABP7K8J6_9RHOB